MIRYSIVWYNMVLYGIVWYNIIGHSMVLYATRILILAAIEVLLMMCFPSTRPMSASLSIAQVCKLLLFTVPVTVNHAR